MIFDSQTDRFEHLVILGKQFGLHGTVALNEMSFRDTFITYSDNSKCSVVNAAQFFLCIINYLRQYFQLQEGKKKNSYKKAYVRDFYYMREFDNVFLTA